MQCIYCKSDTYVRDTVASGKKVIRERVCKENKHIFYTEENAPKLKKQFFELKKELSLMRKSRKKKGVIA